MLQYFARFPWRRSDRLASALFAFLGLSLGLLAANTAQAVDMMSHRALYSVKLGETKGTGGRFTGAEGAMSLQIEKTCDGWIMGQKMQMRLDTVVDGEFQQDLSFTGWESLDFDQYRFVSRNQFNAQVDKSNGRADRKKAEASFSQPEEKSLTLPENTLFPIGHTLWLIEQAEAGNRFVNATVFDGSDGGPPQKVTAFIAKAVNPADHRAGQKDLGDPVAATGWPIRLAFYPLDGRSAEPEYEVELFQLANGAATRMLLDYEEFSIMLTLEEIETIPLPDCG